MLLQHNGRRYGKLPTILLLAGFMQVPVDGEKFSCPGKFVLGELQKTRQPKNCPGRPTGFVLDAGLVKVPKCLFVKICFLT